VIKFFRKIRRRLLEQQQTTKYFKYALGEIVLVVIGILIALQINNWNEEKIQKAELNDVLMSIANGVKSDIRELSLLSTARANVVTKVDSIQSYYVPSAKTSIELVEAAYINFTYQNILNTIQFNSNLNALESLKNSAYFGKIQGTDLALLLSTYFTNAEKIKTKETEYNQTCKKLEQDWNSNLKNNGGRIFIEPWMAGDFTVVADKFLEILRNDRSLAILELAENEAFFIKPYEEQILMGEKLVEMIQNTTTVFDQKTKLELSSVLFSFGDADLVSLLTNGEVPTAFSLNYAASGVFTNHFSTQKDYLTIMYPENQYDWGSCYFLVDALYGRVNEMDFSTYSTVFLEMKGEVGGEVFEIAMKDINDPPDGSESRVSVDLTTDWKLFEIKTNQFKTANMNRIMVPMAFVFEGSEGKKIHVRSIQFKKD
jgi:hypothetical protein